jgi:hypothetical protein
MVKVRINTQALYKLIIRITDLFDNLNFEFDNQFKMFSLYREKPFIHQFSEFEILYSEDKYTLFFLTYKQMIKVLNFLKDIEADDVIIKFNDFELSIEADNERLVFFE